jgi:hypothetical protein
MREAKVRPRYARIPFVIGSHLRPTDRHLIDALVWMKPESTRTEFDIGNSRRASRPMPIAGC